MNSISITLRSGGRVFLVPDVDLSKLTPSDRAFVMELIESLERYAASSPNPEAQQ